MFGTLRIARCQAPEEYSRYRLYYCGLCHLLAADYGNLSRILLSYDVTLFYLLFSSLTGFPPQTAQIKCPVSLGRSKLAVVDERVGKMAAAVNVYLAGMKLRDDIQDDGRSLKRAAYRVFRSREKLAADYLKSLGVDIERAEEIFAIQRVKELTCQSLRDFAYATEVGLGLLFGEAARILELDASCQQSLQEVGAGLGRIIYILDSFVDYPADLRCHRFNALDRVYGGKISLHEALAEDVRIELLNELDNSFTRAASALAKLGLPYNKSVVDAVMAFLQERITKLIAHTHCMMELETQRRQGSLRYKLSHPQHLWQSQLAAHRHRDAGCCDDLCTLWICCDAADCDCDTVEACAQGDCCECRECCG